MKTYEEYQVDIENDPKNPYFWLAYTKALSKLPEMVVETTIAVKKTMECLAECEREHWWFEEFVELYGILGMCYARRGWFERAHDKITEGLCVRPDYYPFWALRANVSAARADRDMENYKAEKAIVEGGEEESDGQRDRQGG